MVSALKGRASSLLRLLSPPPSLPNSYRLRSTPIPTSRPFSHFPLFFSTDAPKASPSPPSSSSSEDGEEQEGEADKRKKRHTIYVGNLPFDISAPHLETVFSQCCPVGKIDLRVTRKDNGEIHGWAFISVGSADDAHAIIEKFNSSVLLDKTIKVEYPKVHGDYNIVPKELLHTVYVSNLERKVKKGDLREFFSAFKPIYVEKRSSRCTHGFVKFATKEGALAAIAELNGKELMGKQPTMKLKEKKSGDKSVIEKGPSEKTGEPESF